MSLYMQKLKLGLIQAVISLLTFSVMPVAKAFSFDDLEKVEKGLIPNSSTIRVCPDCGTRNLHYYVDTNNWCCACC